MAANRRRRCNRIVRLINSIGHLFATSKMQCRNEVNHPPPHGLQILQIPKRRLGIKPIQMKPALFEKLLDFDAKSLPGTLKQAKLRRCFDEVTVLTWVIFCERRLKLFLLVPTGFWWQPTPSFGLVHARFRSLKTYYSRSWDSQLAFQFLQTQKPFDTGLTHTIP